MTLALDRDGSRWLRSVSVVPGNAGVAWLHVAVLSRSRWQHTPYDIAVGPHPPQPGDKTGNSA